MQQEPESSQSPSGMPLHIIKGDIAHLANMGHALIDTRSREVGVEKVIVVIPEYLSPVPDCPQECPRVCNVEDVPTEHEVAELFQERP